MEDKTMKTVKQKQEAFIASLMPDSDKRMVRIASASLIVALSLGFWASTYERIIDEVIFETPSEKTLETTLNLKPPPPKVEKQHEKKEKNTDKQDISRKHKGGGGKPSGKGDPKAALQRGVLEVLTAMKNNAAAQAYVLAKKTFEKDVDKRLKLLNGLQVSGKTKIASVRRGIVDAGYNDLVAGGGSGGITNSLGRLLGGTAGAISTKAMKGNIKPPNANEIDMGSGGGSRSASDIMKVVRQRTPGLRHIYNKHLKKNPGFQGKVTLRFTIAPGGEIVSIAVASSTTGYGAFDTEIKNAVGRWTFTKIKSGNTTVTIPFTFTE